MLQSVSANSLGHGEGGWKDGVIRSKIKFHNYTFNLSTLSSRKFLIIINRTYMATLHVSGINTTVVWQGLGFL